MIYYLCQKKTSKKLLDSTILSMTKKQFRFPDNLLYQSTYVWVRDVGRGIYSVGITDFCQYMLDDIVSVSFPVVGDSVEKDEEIISIESIYENIDIPSPISGKIIDVNEDLRQNPEDINERPFQTWLIKIEAEDEDELEDLYSADEAFDLFQAELEEQGDEELTRELGAFVQLEEEDDDWI